MLSNEKVEKLGWLRILLRQNGGKSALFRVTKVFLKCHFLNPSEQCHCFVLQSPSLTDFCSYVI